MCSASSSSGLAKRFYKDTAVEETSGGYMISLDGRAVKTPAKQTLTLAKRELAEAVAGEWRAQEEEIRQETMPMMRFICTTLDRVTPQRTAVVADTVRYGETDLLCYRAAEPAELVHLQAVTWQPLLDWAESRYGACLAITDGITAITQDADSLSRLARVVEVENDLTLTGLHYTTAATGSLIVALALLEGEIDAEGAWSAAHIDEHWQIKRWGADEELSERLENLRRDISAVGEFLALSRY